VGEESLRQKWIGWTLTTQAEGTLQGKTAYGSLHAKLDGSCPHQAAEQRLQNVKALGVHQISSAGTMDRWLFFQPNAFSSAE
jgi:hypothetical protein